MNDDTDTALTALDNNEYVHFLCKELASNDSSAREFQEAIQETDAWLNLVEWASHRGWFKLDNVCFYEIRDFYKNN